MFFWVEFLYSKYRRVEQDHADDDQDADDCPSYLDLLLMFFVEKHIINITYREKFST